MAEYAVHVRTDLDHATDDQLDALVDALVEVAGVPSMLGGRLSVQLTVDADNMTGALHAAGTAVHRAGHDALGVDVHATGVEVLTADEFERQLTTPPLDDLVPTVEAARILGVSRQRVLQLADANVTFPHPVNLGGRGLYWHTAELRVWLAEHREQPAAAAGS